MSRRMLALLAALLLAGCTTAPSTVDTPVALNDTDLMFLRMILPHHRQGVELAALGRAKGTREELVQLAAAIESTQEDEVELMAGVLAGSGAPQSVPVPPSVATPGGADPLAASGGGDPLAASAGVDPRTGAGGVGSGAAPGGVDPHGGHGGVDPHAAHGGVPGTDPRRVAVLRAAVGVEFERRFLETMMDHQGDAVVLAKMELASGADERLVDLAGRIERSRTAQIAQMQGLLDATPL